LSSDIQIWGTPPRQWQRHQNMLRLSRLQGIISSLPRTWHTQQISETKECRSCWSSLSMLSPLEQGVPICLITAELVKHVQQTRHTILHLRLHGFPGVSVSKARTARRRLRLAYYLWYTHTGVHQLFKISNWQWCT
jgi:hypothetical protein